MKTPPLYLKIFVSAVVIFVSSQSLAAELRIAVASNFSDAITAIADHFEAKTKNKLQLIFGSTGKHYAQIKNGAPFDIFFSADAHHAELLEKEGGAVAGSRFTYAVGKLVLWSPEKNTVDADGTVLTQGRFHHLAIANPKLAPYGQAAQEVLQARGLWERLDKTLVRGENIGQTLQFIRSGNAELGFVAYAQVQRPNQLIEGSYWLVPANLYSPIEQQAVILKDSEAARAFMAFVRSPEALQIIRDYGYDVP